MTSAAATGTAAAVVLAAGEGARFAASGGRAPKLLAPLGGRPVVAWSLAAAAVCDQVFVVVGPVGVPVPDGVQVVTSPRWREGLAASLQAGIGAARAAGHAAVVVGLGDQPAIPAGAWRRVAGATGSAVAVATYGGGRGHPVRLAAEVWPLLPATGEAGARVLMRRHPELVTEVPCGPGPCPGDVDTVGDLDALRRSPPGG